MIDLIEERTRWPDRTHLEAALKDWDDARERFIVAVTAAQWMLVASTFDEVRRVAAMVHPGEPCADDDLAVLRGLKSRLPPVIGIVGDDAVPRRQRADLREEIDKLRR
jgi:hypothetical protein